MKLPPILRAAPAHKLPTILAALSAAALSLFAGPAFAQATPKPSICQAVARAIPPGPTVRYAQFDVTPKKRSDAAPRTGGEALGRDEVAIRFDSHSTYVIETAAGVRIATDYAGFLRGERGLPRVVTMNRAHSSHYTMNPDPGIEHVLHGWGETDRGGAAAEHYITVDDVVVRNVTTDIIRYGNVPNGNSIFIFEVAGLCIGHLGHLHHMPLDSHFAAIGRLDVVMVPVDGGLTLSHVGMRDVLQRLRSSIVLPMHLRSYNALPRFLDHVGADFAVRRPRENELIVSLRSLPRQPTVVVLPNLD